MKFFTLKTIFFLLFSISLAHAEDKVTQNITVKNNSYVLIYMNSKAYHIDIQRIKKAKMDFNKLAVWQKINGIKNRKIISLNLNTQTGEVIVIYTSIGITIQDVLDKKKK